MRRTGRHGRPGCSSLATTPTAASSGRSSPRSRSPLASRGGGQLASQAGLFLCTRQGELTIRSAQDIDPATTRQKHGLRETALHITDADIIEVGSWEGFDPGQDTLSRLVRVFTGESSIGRDLYSGDALRMSPAEDSLDRDLSAVLWASVGDPASAADGTAQRWLCWLSLVREVLELEVSLRFAEATVFDVVRLTTDRLYGCLPETAQGYADQPAVILRHQPRLLPGDNGPRCSLLLAILPTVTESS